MHTELSPMAGFCQAMAFGLLLSAAGLLLLGSAAPGQGAEDVKVSLTCIGTIVNMFD